MFGTGDMEILVKLRAYIILSMSAMMERHSLFYPPVLLE